jgi:hypothetical protein
MNREEIPALVTRLDDHHQHLCRAFAHYYGAPSITCRLVPMEIDATDRSLYRPASVAELRLSCHELHDFVAALLVGRGGAMAGEFERACREHAATLAALRAGHARYQADLGDFAARIGRGLRLRAGGRCDLVDLGGVVVCLAFGCDVHLA